MTRKAINYTVITILCIFMGINMMACNDQNSPMERMANKSIETSSIELVDFRMLDTAAKTADSPVVGNFVLTNSESEGGNPQKASEWVMSDGFPWYVLPTFLSFVLITFLFILYYTYRSFKSLNKPSYSFFILVVLLIGWLIVQAVLASSGFFNAPRSMPPRLMFAFGPILLILLLLFIIPGSYKVMKEIPVSALTYIHTIRIPVELVLWWLYLDKGIPELMTFQGRNPDILMGITAPIIGYLCFTKKILSQKIALVWTLISLVFVINIVTYALLSFRSPIQMFAFDQPNVALATFPFIWLPCFVVPVVIFFHLLAVRRLLSKT
ncbi:MAG: hypothetical protein IEMM0008_1355 [bacterium]|nr:MAG: hypothetical protein IEMM0008_1355 [bacterium]